jgi:hypothetical protein
MRRLDDDSLITWKYPPEVNHSHLIFFFFSRSVCHPPKPTSFMSPSPLPQWHSPTQSFHGRISSCRNCFSHSFNSIPGIGISLGSLLCVGLIFFMTFLSPHAPLLLSSSKRPTPTNHASSSHTSDEAPSLRSDVLSLEQVRDIVATTRGFFSRDYSLYLGWNNVSFRGNPIGPN